MKQFDRTRVKTRLHSYRNNVLLKRFTAIIGVDILVKASGFILIPVYLRLMSQEEYGMYNYLLSIIQTFSLVLNLGLYVPQSKLYHSYESKEEKGKLLFTIITTLLFFIVIISIPVFVFRLDQWLIEVLFSGSVSYNQYIKAVLFALVSTLLSFMLTNFFYTSEKIKQVKAYNIFRIILVNLFAMLALYFIKGDAVETRLLFTYGVELVLICFFGYYFVRELVPVFSKKILVTSLKMGLPIMVSALFGIIVNFSDKYFLEKYGTLKDLSNYYLAFSFASIIPLIFASLQNVWIPLFMKEKDIQKNVEKTNKLISKLLLLFLPLALFIWLLFESLLWINVIPVKYAHVTYILPILLITQILASISPLFSNYLVYFEKTQLISIAGILVSIVSLAAGLWLIPLWGVYGAAITSLISNLLYLLIYQYMVKSYAIKKG